MEKQADPVDKVEGATSLAPVEGATSLAPEKEEQAVLDEGAAAMDPTKEKNTEGAVSDKQESSKDLASLPSTSVHDVPRGSIEESESESRPESPAQESIAAPVQQRQTQEANNAPCTSNGKRSLIFGASSLICAFVALWLLTEVSKGVEYKLWAAFFTTLGIFLFFMALWAYCTKKGVPCSEDGDPSIHYEDLRMDAGCEDVESRRIGSSGSEHLEETDRQQDGSDQSTAGPSHKGASSLDVPSEKQPILQPTTSKGNSVKKLSELASAVSQIASGTRQQDGSDQSTAGPSQEGASSSGVPSEKQPILQPTTSKGNSVMKLSEIGSAVSQIASGTTQEGPKESVQENPKDRNVGEKADDNLQKDSEQEGLSSTELRRRNFQNPDSCTDLMKPAEAKE